MHKTSLDDAYIDFLKHLPEDGDSVLLILKGHLLIENQIYLLIQNRLPKPDTLKPARLTSYQKICLAQALVSETQSSVDSWLWKAVIKLNELRNSIVHNLSVSDVEAGMSSLVKLASKANNSNDIRGDFESTLLTIYFEIHNRIEKLDESDYDLE